MDIIYDKCCGIDVHKKLIVACFRCGKKQDVRNFGATTRELLELADWLKEGGCEMVAMESTASYWKPLYNILESSDLNAMVVNARHMKAVPGRKTDVKDGTTAVSKKKRRRSYEEKSFSYVIGGDNGSRLTGRMQYDSRADRRWTDICF